MLDWFEPIHDPGGVVSRTVLRLDQLAARRGVRLYPQTDFHGLKDVAAANRQHGSVLAPNVDADLSRLGDANATWILGVDKDGQPATTQAGRYFDWSGTTLGAEMESFRFFYEHPVRHLTADCFCRMPRPAADQIVGAAFHTGTIWVRPDLRGPDEEGIILSQLLGRMIRLIGIAHWWPDYLFSFSTRALRDRGVVKNFGWSHHDPGAEWKLPGEAVYEGGLSWMSREEMLDWASAQPTRHAAAE